MEESQLIFRAGGGHISADDLVVMADQKKGKSEKLDTTLGSVDAIAMLDEDYFVTGADNG